MSNAKDFFDTYTGGNNNVATWTEKAIIEFAEDYHRKQSPPVLPLVENKEEVKVYITKAAGASPNTLWLMPRGSYEIPIEKYEAIIQAIEQVLNPPPEGNTPASEQDAYICFQTNNKVKLQRMFPGGSCISFITFKIDQLNYDELEKHLVTQTQSPPSLQEREKEDEFKWDDEKVKECLRYFNYWKGHREMSIDAAISHIKSKHLKP